MKNDSGSARARARDRVAARTRASRAARRNRCGTRTSRTAWTRPRHGRRSSGTATRSRRQRRSRRIRDVRTTPFRRSSKTTLFGVGALGDGRVRDARTPHDAPQAQLDRAATVGCVALEPPRRRPVRAEAHPHQRAAAVHERVRPEPVRRVARTVFVGDARAEESVTRRRRAATFLREGASRRRRTTFATLIPSFETRVPNASIAATSHCAYRRCAAVASALPPERDDASNRRGLVGDAKYENPRRMADLADGGTKPPSIIRESPPSFEFLSRRSRPATHPGGAELTASSASAANSCSPA